jgi:mannosyltransferase OCH1-like enzyme
MEKYLHQIWLGKNPLPRWFPAYQETWRQHFAGWKYKLWSDADVAGMVGKFICQTPFTQGLNVGLQSDVLRLELLRQHGGLYVDVDFECLRNFADFLPGDCFAYGDELPLRPGNALLAAPAGHGFVEHMLHAVERYLQRALKSRVGLPTVQATSGPDALHRALQTWVWSWDDRKEIKGPDAALVGARYADIAVFRQEVFFPYWYEGDSRTRWEKARKEGRTLQEYPNTFAAHHWGGTWQ